MRSILFINRGNLTQPIQMQLPQKEKPFSQYSSGFLKSILNFEHFQKKMTLITDVFPTLRTSKDVVRYLSRTSQFRGPVARQHGKLAETLLQSEGQHLYHIY